MNKHAKNLQTMLALLPIEVCHAYRDTIHEAVIEIDRLDTALAKHENPSCILCLDRGFVYEKSTGLSTHVEVTCSCQLAKNRTGPR
jgi:hypothetical protein